MRSNANGRYTVIVNSYLQIYKVIFFSHCSGQLQQPTQKINVPLMEFLSVRNTFIFVDDPLLSHTEINQIKVEK